MLIKDKLGNELTVEIEKIDPLAFQFSESLSNCLANAFLPGELQYAQQYPDRLADDKFLHSISLYFENELVDWEIIKEKIYAILLLFFHKGFAESVAANSEMSSKYNHFLMTAKKDELPVGCLYCMLNQDGNEQVLRVPILAVDPSMQLQGIGRLMMDKICQELSIDKIFLSTRKTNLKAIKAYLSWGFKEVPSKMEGWIAYQLEKRQA